MQMEKDNLGKSYIDTQRYTGFDAQQRHDDERLTRCGLKPGFPFALQPLMSRDGVAQGFEQQQHASIRMQHGVTSHAPSH